MPRLGQVFGVLQPAARFVQAVQGLLERYLLVGTHAIAERHSAHESFEVQEINRITELFQKSLQTALFEVTRIGIVTPGTDINIRLLAVEHLLLPGQLLFHLILYRLDLGGHILPGEQFFKIQGTIADIP